MVTLKGVLAGYGIALVAAFSGELIFGFLLGERWSRTGSNTLLLAILLVLIAWLLWDEWQGRRGKRSG